MSTAGTSLAFRQRFGLLLLAALAVAIVHRTVAQLAAEPLRVAAHGYGDAELLAAGGDLALQLLVQRQDALVAALSQVGLWLLGGRVFCFLAVFVLYLAAFSLAAPARGSAPAQPRLHLGWALLLSVAASLTSGALLAAGAWAFVRLGRALQGRPAADLPAYLAAAALGLALVWALCEVWLSLVCLALAGARLRPFAAAKIAGRAWLENWGRLLPTRLVLGATSLAVSAASVLLLPSVTRGSPTERTWATVAIDLGLLGAICLRGAWLTWASAHLALPRDQTSDLTPATCEDAAPSAIPDAPVDPSPSPGA